MSPAPLDVDAARSRLRAVRGRVDRLPSHALRGVIPSGTTEALLGVLADLGLALDRIGDLERTLHLLIHTRDASWGAHHSAYMVAELVVAGAAFADAGESVRLQYEEASADG
jgi:hypothetical protein